MVLICDVNNYALTIEQGMEGFTSSSAATKLSIKKKNTMDSIRARTSIRLIFWDFIFINFL